MERVAHFSDVLLPRAPIAGVVDSLAPFADARMGIIIANCEEGDISHESVRNSIAPVAILRISEAAIIV